MLDPDIFLSVISCGAHLIWLLDEIQQKIQLREVGFCASYSLISVVPE